MTSRRSAIAVLAAGAAAACSPFRLLNALPADPARKVAADVPYGTDPRQRLDVWAPAKPAGRLPVLVFFYGGSWSSGSKGDYAFAAKALASEGFVVAVPDYRLVPQVRFPAFVDDAAAATAFVHAHAAEWGGDPARLALAGHSAGAYLAAMTALETSRLERASAPRGAVKAWAGLSGPYDFYPFDVDASREAFGAWPRPGETQPITYAGPGDPPAFLAHGLDDATVKPRNTRALAAKLRAAGVPVEERLYPDLDHKDTVLALTRTFRGKAAVRADMVRFLKARVA